MADTSTPIHEDHIRRCMELAAQAVRLGNNPYGSVITRDGQIIAEGHNLTMTELDVTAHGEVTVIRRASQKLGTTDLSGTTLYTNCEPCYMCSYAIRAARISRVVIGARDPSKGGVSSSHPILTEPSTVPWGPVPEVIRDVLRGECEAQLRAHQAPPLIQPPSLALTLSKHARP